MLISWRFRSLIKIVSKSGENEVKGQRLGMLAATLASTLLGNVLEGKGIIRAGEGTIRARRRSYQS